MLRYALFALMLVLGAHRADARPFLKVLGDAPAPNGWRGFCHDHPRTCHPGPRTPQKLALTARLRRDLGEVNRWVNAHIKPKSDVEHWGIADKWDYADDGYGDCEDYALLKQRMLTQKGWNPSALLLAAVGVYKKVKVNGSETTEFEWHTALMVVTTEGGLVLDDQNDEVLPWHKTKYWWWVRRQSPEDPNTWKRIEPRLPTS